MLRRILRHHLEFLEPCGHRHGQVPPHLDSAVPRFRELQKVEPAVVETQLGPAVDTPAVDELRQDLFQVLRISSWGKNLHRHTL